MIVKKNIYYNEKLDAERRWASKLIRKETNENLPNT